jgi:hypothetical protein
LLTPIPSPPAPANNSIARIAPLPQKQADTLRGSLAVANLALPKDKNPPTLLRESRLIPQVPFAVMLKLWTPERESGLGKSRQPTTWIGVAMPKTTVDEDGGAVTREN